MVMSSDTTEAAVKVDVDIANNDPNNNAVQKTYTIDDVIDHAGMGRFQWFLLIATGLAWFAESMETVLIGFVLPILSSQWDLNDNIQTPLLGSAMFSGMMIGALLWGALSDRFGRKKTMFVNVLLTCALGITTACSPNWIFFLILRVFTGIAVAGNHIPFNLFSEFLPVHMRGSMLIASQFFWTLGCVLEAILAWIFLPMETINFGAFRVDAWRFMMVTISLPLLFVLAFLPFLPESPRYLLSVGKKKECEEVLRRVVRINRQTPMEGTLTDGSTNPSNNETKEEEHEHISFISRVKSLFQHGMWRITCVILLVTYVYYFCYYGTVIMTPSYFEVKTGDESSTDYLSILITSAAELPGMIAAAFAVNWLGRRRTQTVCFLLFSAATLILIAPAPLWVRTIFAVISRACVMAGFSTLMVMVPEVFPTTVRGTGIGVCAGMGQIAAFMTPFVATSLFRSSEWAALSVYGVMAFIGAGFTLLISVETAGRRLEDFVPSASGAMVTINDAPSEKMEITIPACKGEDVFNEIAGSPTSPIQGREESC
ncbi:sugar transporter [Acrasis kona]|uniref:Sugar transporter n=1 Tax=Acrasis kona TaxID=1008807 RepID=A0AAW2ZP76_9EUKA